MLGEAVRAVGKNKINLTVKTRHSDGEFSGSWRRRLGGLLLWLVLVL